MQKRPALSKTHAKTVFRDLRGWVVFNSFLLATLAVLALLMMAHPSAAQPVGNMEEWQSKAFREIEAAKRLEVLRRQAQRKRSIVKRTKKRRPARRVSTPAQQAITPPQRMEASLPEAQTEASRRLDISESSAPSRVNEPGKLQSCLKKTGYYDGEITGELSRDTWLAFDAFRNAKNLQTLTSGQYDDEGLKMLYAACIEAAIGQKPQLADKSLSGDTEKLSTDKPSAGNPSTNRPSRSEMEAASDKRGETILAKSEITAKNAREATAGMSVSGIRDTNANFEAHFAQEIQAATGESDESSSRLEDETATARAATTTRTGLNDVRRRIAAMPSLLPLSKTHDRSVAPSQIASAAQYSSSAAHSSRPNQAFPRLSIADLKPTRLTSANTCSPRQYGPQTGEPLITGSISTGRQNVRSNTNSISLWNNRYQPADTRTCLQKDLFDLLKKAHGHTRGLEVCKAGCLPAPRDFSGGQREIFARQYDIKWCDQGCFGIADPMPLQDVLRVERDARVEVCMDPRTRLIEAAAPQDDDFLNSIQQLFDNLPGGYGNSDNIAVLIGNRNYRSLEPNPAAAANLEAMKTLLVEHLGYQSDNVVLVHDATSGDLKKLFGTGKPAEGVLGQRIAANPNAQLLIYYSGYAHSRAAGFDNSLLGIDARAGQEEKAGITFAALFESLRRLDARSTQLFLEADFNETRGPSVLAPNVAERQVTISPLAPVRGLTVFAAAKGDQKPLIDHETGIGLFTRYLVSGLAGAADEKPVGNGDRVIDSTELYVHLAGKVRLSARKTLGLLQNPVMSRESNLFLSQLSRARGR